jgi:hypothetical protein
LKGYFDVNTNVPVLSANLSYFGFKVGKLLSQLGLDGLQLLTDQHLDGCLVPVPRDLGGYEVGLDVTSLNKAKHWT